MRERRGFLRSEWVSPDFRRFRLNAGHLFGTIASAIFPALGCQGEWQRFPMASVAKWSKAPVCGTGDHGFESRRSPQPPVPFAPVAQWIEHWASDPGVAGSSPARRATRFPFQPAPDADSADSVLFPGCIYIRGSVPFGCCLGLGISFSRKRYSELGEPGNLAAGPPSLHAGVGGPGLRVEGAGRSGRPAG